MCEYFLQDNRRATFKKWVHPNDARCSASKMAEAGFIFTGSSRDPNSAQCFFCYKSLDGWEVDDDPWQEHINHSPNCEFAKIQKPQDDLTLNEYMDLVKKFGDSLINRKYEEIKDKMHKKFEVARHIVKNHSY